MLLGSAGTTPRCRPPLPPRYRTACLAHCRGTRCVSLAWDSLWRRVDLVLVRHLLVEDPSEAVVRPLPNGRMTATGGSDSKSEGTLNTDGPPDRRSQTSTPMPSTSRIMPAAMSAKSHAGAEMNGAHHVLSTPPPTTATAIA